MTDTETFLVTLGRKIELDEVTTEMVEDAAAWLRSWSGDFEFLQDVKTSLLRKGKISPAQAKGVLNCWRAELARQAKAQGEQPNGGQDAQPGIYVQADGSIWKVQPNKAGTNVYAKVWISITGERLTLAGTREHGEWDYVAGGIRTLSTASKMTLEQAKAFILLYGRCVRCGRTLKAADSVERGIGPVCVTYFEGWGG